jgi:hypothetical protein
MFDYERVNMVWCSIASTTPCLKPPTSSHLMRRRILCLEHLQRWKLCWEILFRTMSWKEIPQETHGFLPTNMEVSDVNSPWNQSSENLDQLINMFFSIFWEKIWRDLGFGFGSYFWDSQNGGLDTNQKKTRLGTLKFLPISHGERNNPPH